MADIVKTNWSGGKDSTCAVMKHIEREDIVKAVCYIPKLTKDIPLLNKRHFEFIETTTERFRSLGAQVDIISGMTYEEFVLHIITKGKRTGKIYGFPCFIAGMCNFRDYSKVKALEAHGIGDFDYQDIGIAYDEEKRKNYLNGKMRSILCELMITEAQAREYCVSNGLLSPHYNTNRRDGCTLCPNAKPEERRKWFSEYPEARSVVEYLQNEVKKTYPTDEPRRYPLRNKKWFIGEGSEEEDFEKRPIQLSLFDFE